MEISMKILFASSEALPYSSSGGLGDVLLSLPKEIKQYSQTDVRIILPLYRYTKERYIYSLEFIGATTVSLAWRNQYCGIYKTINNGITFYFIDNEYYFSRHMLYGEYDDGERFAFFSKAVIDVMSYLDFYPDILHANDWQTAASVIYLKTLYSHLDHYKYIKSVFTIHNFDYQGCFDNSTFHDLFGFSENSRNAICIGEKINLVKGAIEYADSVTTVSKTYAKEIKTFDYSGKLCGVINDNFYKISGVINGIDTDYYSSERDADITANYSSKDIAGKATNKRMLQGICNLPLRDDIPILCVISRLTEHKGIDLITSALDILLKKDLQIIILGTGDTKYENYLIEKSKEHSNQMCVNIKFDKILSKKIYAGSDIFLMPSLREPCGLAQMIASRYGTVPVVRKTGGLADTINENCYEKNGFVFEQYNVKEMLSAIDRALTEYNNINEWNNLVRRVMDVDFSWEQSAKRYMDIYKKLL